jgi:phosphoglycolate phosphatase-like HAD superfamily hydrolase
MKPELEAKLKEAEAKVEKMMAALAIQKKEMADEHGLLTTWEVDECDNLLDDHGFDPCYKVIFEDDNVFKVVRREEPLTTWLDLWIASEEVINKAGMKFVTIETFEEEPEGVLYVKVMDKN